VEQHRQRPKAHRGDHVAWHVTHLHAKESEAARGDQRHTRGDPGHIRGDQRAPWISTQARRAPRDG
jgi:hypothetical protein